jgi:hypothetical protein
LNRNDMTTRHPHRLADPSFEPSESLFDALAVKAQAAVATRKAGADKRFLARVRAEVRSALSRAAHKQG